MKLKLIPTFFIFFLTFSCAVLLAEDQVIIEGDTIRIIGSAKSEEKNHKQLPQKKVIEETDRSEDDPEEQTPAEAMAEADKRLAERNKKNRENIRTQADRFKERKEREKSIWAQYGEGKFDDRKRYEESYTRYDLN